MAVAVCVGIGITKTRYFEVFGDSGIKQYVGNKKLFTFCISVKESIQMVTFPKVKTNQQLTISIFIFSLPLCVTIRQFVSIRLHNNDYRIQPSKLTIERDGIGTELAKITITSHPGKKIKCDLILNTHLKLNSIKLRSFIPSNSCE